MYGSRTDKAHSQGGRQVKKAFSEWDGERSEYDRNHEREVIADQIAQQMDESSMIVQHFAGTTISNPYGGTTYIAGPPVRVEHVVNLTKPMRESAPADLRRPTRPKRERLTVEKIRVHALASLYGVSNEVMVTTLRQNNEWVAGAHSSVVKSQIVTMLDQVIPVARPT